MKSRARISRRCRDEEALSHLFFKDHKRTAKFTPLVFMTRLFSSLITVIRVHSCSFAAKILFFEICTQASVLIFNSANWPGATALGESVIRSDPLATFGKAITSRSDLAFAKSITVRSSPMAIPPCGGVP